MVEKTKMAVSVFNEAALEYQGKYMDVSQYRDAFDLFCGAVEKPGAAVLDIACGPGNVAKYLLGKRPDFRILGIDLAPNMLELARANCPEAEFRIMDCRQIRTLGRRFEAIMCAFCLPYLSKEEALYLVADVAETLRPGGVFFLSTMEDSYEKSRLQRSSSGAYELFMHFHQADYLCAGLLENGFDLLDLRREENGTAAPDLLIVSRLRGQNQLKQ